MRLLIAEDDRALGTFLARGLEQDGHEVIMATDGEMAMEAAKNDIPEMAVLDLNLPRRDGTEVLEFLRSLTDDLPILILSARQEPETRLRCLEMGADDFMQKPFSFVELRARCRALMRRRTPALVLRQGDLELRRVERTVTRNGEPVALTGKEFALLEYLMLHRGRPVSRATLLQEVWNMNAGAGTNVVDVYINYLRRKLHDTPEPRSGDVKERQAETAAPLIRTVRGVGYSIGIRA
ncbi:MAG: response regulator transcription factor [Acidobacteriaceae bacterium]|jgi:DNA-binding response OmpR family regulator